MSPVSPPARPQAVPTTLIDNDRTITTEWRFARGAETGWHRHGHDYVVVPMTTGKLKLEEPGGAERIVELTAGKPYYRAEGVEHNVVNASDGEFVFIEIEMRKP
jgi:quercetin dioxygenase-like cupin family protein